MNASGLRLETIRRVCAICLILVSKEWSCQISWLGTTAVREKYYFQERRHRQSKPSKKGNHITHSNSRLLSDVISFVATTLSFPVILVSQLGPIWSVPFTRCTRPRRDPQFDGFADAIHCTWRGCVPSHGNTVCSCVLPLRTAFPIPWITVSMHDRRPAMTMRVWGVVCRRGPVVVSADVGRRTVGCPVGECWSRTILDSDFMQVVSSTPPGEGGAPREVGAGIRRVLRLELYLLSKSLRRVYALWTGLKGASSRAILW